MHDGTRWRITPFGDLIFAVCVAAAAWLLFKNAARLMVLPWNQVPLTLHAAAAATRALLATVTPLALIPLTIGLGWIAARPPSKPVRPEVRHE